MEVRNFPYDDWHEVKSYYYEKIKEENMPFNYEILTNFMKKDNPKADGLVFTENNGKLNHMIVVWNPIKSIYKDKLTIIN